MTALERLVKVLITGASGFIGGHLVLQLIKESYVTAGLFLDSDNFQRSPLTNPNNHPISELRPFFADLRDFQRISQVIDAYKPDIVIHLAASGVADPFLPVNEAVQNNILGTTNLLRACFERETRHRPTKMIIARTAGEINPVNVYAASKAAVWTFCSMYSRVNSWPIVGAMIFQAFGPYQPQNMVVPAAFKAASSDQDFPMTTGRQMKDWIYVDDVVAGISSLIPADILPGSTIELGTGLATPLIKVIETIYELTSGRGRPLPGTLPSRPGEARIQAADSVSSRIQSGWSAQISWNEGLSRYHKWITTNIS